MISFIFKLTSVDRNVNSIVAHRKIVYKYGKKNLLDQCIIIVAMYNKLLSLAIPRCSEAGHFSIVVQPG